MKHEEFEIEGHQYYVRTHVGSDGQKYALYFASLLPEALAPVAGKALQGGKVDLEADLGEFDLTSAAGAVRQHLQDLMDRPALIQGMFRHAERDGKPLNNTSNYDAAYGEGNWTEWYQAVVKIVTLNGWIPLASISAVKNLEDKLEKTAERVGSSREES